MPPHAQELLLELIGKAYDAGLGTKPWSVLLEPLAEALGGRATHFLVHDERGCSGLVGAVRSDPEWQRKYLEHYSSVNPYLSHPAAKIQPGVVHSGEWLTRAELERTEFYSDFLRRQDVFPVLVGNLFADTRRQGYLASYRRFHGTPFGASERRLLGRLLPHIQRAVQICGVVGQTGTMRSSWAAAFDLLEQGIVALDRCGVPVIVNRAAHRLLTAENGVVLAHDGLRATHPDDERALRALLASTQRTAARLGLGAGGALPVRRAGGGHMSVFAAPLPHQTISSLTLEDCSRTPTVIVFVSDPGARVDPEIPEEMLVTLFGLTPREIEVARLLGRGVAVASIAKQLGIAFHTARVHQRRVYEKTGVHSQAQLVRAFRAIAPPLRPERE